MKEKTILIAKRCKDCRNLLPASSYYWSKNKPTVRCRSCHLGYCEKRRRENPEAIKKIGARYYQNNKEEIIRKQSAYSRLRPEIRRKINFKQKLRRYGLTLKSYGELLEEQRYTCAICGQVHRDGSSLHIDHDHATGAVRGILCANCNLGLGRFRDDASLLEKAIEYLGAKR